MAGRRPSGTLQRVASGAHLSRHPPSPGSCPASPWRLDSRAVRVQKRRCSLTLPRLVFTCESTCVWSHPPHLPRFPPQPPGPSTLLRSSRGPFRPPHGLGCSAPSRHTCSPCRSQFK